MIAGLNLTTLAAHLDRLAGQLSFLGEDVGHGLAALGRLDAREIDIGFFDNRSAGAVHLADCGCLTRKLLGATDQY